jgi:hypothetical protein
MARILSYGYPSTGRRTVVASVHADCAAALEQFRRQHPGLSRSGAVHHLLRLALKLEPFELPPQA